MERTVIEEEASSILDNLNQPTKVQCQIRKTLKKGKSESVISFPFCGFFCHLIFYFQKGNIVLNLVSFCFFQIIIKMAAVQV